MWNLADFTRIDLTNASLQDESQLMQKLPPEIRHRIYVLVLDDTVTVNIGLHPKGSHKKGLAVAPPLLVTCKQVYAEAVKLYWTDSTFCFPSITGKKFVTWSTKICRRRRELLSSVQVHNVSALMKADAKLGIGSLWQECALNWAAGSGERLLKECQAGRRGIAAGVIKTDLRLPSSKVKTGLGNIYYTITQEVWTAKSKEAVGLYL